LSELGQLVLEKEVDQLVLVLKEDQLILVKDVQANGDDQLTKIKNVGQLELSKEAEYKKTRHISKSDVQ
jgi:hypothetical protein